MLRVQLFYYYYSIKKLVGKHCHYNFDKFSIRDVLSKCNTAEKVFFTLLAQLSINFYLIKIPNPKTTVFHQHLFRNSDTK